MPPPRACLAALALFAASAAKGADAPGTPAAVEFPQLNPVPPLSRLPLSSNGSFAPSLAIRAPVHVLYALATDVAVGLATVADAPSLGPHANTLALVLSETQPHPPQPYTLDWTCALVAWTLAALLLVAATPPPVRALLSTNLLDPPAFGPHLPQHGPSAPPDWLALPRWVKNAPRWMLRAHLLPHLRKARRYRLWQSGGLKFNPCFLGALREAANNSGTNLTGDGLIALLRRLAPDKPFLWNPFCQEWDDSHFSDIAELLAPLGIGIVVAPEDSSHKFAFAAPPPTRWVQLPIVYRRPSREGERELPGHFYYGASVLDALDAFGVYVEPVMFSSTLGKEYGNWSGSGNAPKRPRPTGATPGPKRLTRAASLPTSTLGSRAPVKLLRHAPPTSDNDADDDSPITDDGIDTLLPIKCFACGHQTASDSVARAHANAKHRGAVATDKWCQDALATRCPICFKYLFATRTGQQAHSCAVRLPNMQNSSRPNSTTLVIPGQGTFGIVECGATLTSSAKVSLQLRCAFLAAARSMGAARNNLHAVALKLYEDTIEALTNNHALRATFNPSVITALKRRSPLPGETLTHASLDGAIADFVAHGVADHVEVVALATVLGAPLDVWEQNPNGQIVVNSVAPFGVAPGTAPRPPVLIWRENVHFQALLPEADVARELAAEAAERRATAAARRTGPAPSPTSARTALKDWASRVSTLFVDYTAAPTLGDRRELALQILHSAPARPARRTASPDNPADGMPADDDLDAFHKRDSHDLIPSHLSQLNDLVKSASRELRAGHVSRAMGKLFSAGVLSLDASVRAKIAAKYPKADPAPAPNRMHLDPDVQPDALPDDQDSDFSNNVVSFSVDDVSAFVNSKSPLTGAGHDGWAYRNIKDLLKLARAGSAGRAHDAVLSGIHCLVLDIANGRLNTPTLRPLLTSLRGVALRKRAGSDDVRPIGIGECFTTIAGALAVKSPEVRAAIPASVGPTDWMHGTPGGVEALTHFARAYLRVHPTHVIAKTDIENAFNAISRVDILRASEEYPQLVPLAKMLYGAPNSVIYTDGADTLRLDAERGVTQGEPLAALLYSTALKSAVDATLAKHPSVTVRGIADDRLFFGPPAAVLDALDTYALELAKSLQRMQRAKTTVYSPIADVAFEADCVARGFATADGLLVGGAPIGGAAFVQAELTSFIDAVEAKCGKIAELFRHQQVTNVRTQDFYRILRWCVTPATVNHLLRTVPPPDMRVHAARFDAITYQLFIQILGLDPQHASVNPATADGDLVAARARLAAAAGGLGITSAAATSQYAFLGSLCLTSHLVKSALGDGALADDAAIATALPELAAAVRSNLFVPVPSVASATLRDLVAAPFAHVQRKLSRAAGKQVSADVFKRIIDPTAAAWFLSGQEDGATFLIAYPEFGGGLSDVQFTALVRARLGLQVVPGLDAPEQCPACSGLMANKHVLAPENTTLRPDGLHALTCHEPDLGGLMGYQSARHKHLKASVAEALVRVLPPTAIIDKTEPHTHDFYPFRPGKSTEKRGDLAVTVAGVTKILDTVVSHPNPNVEPRTATVPGFAAHAAHNKKQDLYYNTFVIPTGHMVPLSAETGGRLHDAFKGYIKECVALGLADAGSTAPVWTPATRTIFSSRLRSALVTINIAIARSVATALIRGSKVLVRYGAQHTGPRGAAAAAAPAGGG
jgi:hypothetical protein